MKQSGPNELENRDSISSMVRSGIRDNYLRGSVGEFLKAKIFSSHSAR